MVDETKQIPHCVVTTLSKQNIGELEKLLPIMEELRVYSWQIQIANPMGRMDKNLILSVEEVRQVAKFIAKNRKKRSMCRLSARIVLVICLKSLIYPTNHGRDATLEKL